MTIDVNIQMYADIFIKIMCIAPFFCIQTDVDTIMQ